MKLYLIPLVVSFTVFTYSCSKSNDVLTEQPGHQFEVLEYKTNTAISGATVVLYTCARYDAVFGCRATGFLASKVTDVKGTCTFTDTELRKADEGIKISKEGYFAINGHPGTNYLQPEALLNLHIQRQNPYPDSSYITIKINGELSQVSFISFRAPLDSVVSIKAFGNENNNTEWSVFTKSPGCIAFCITDTLKNGHFSKPLAKGETGTYTLRY